MLLKNLWNRRLILIYIHMFTPRSVPSAAVLGAALHI